MAKAVITNQWKEAIELFAECKIMGTPKLSAVNQMVFKLRDPAGQEFFVTLTATGNVVRNGNLLAIAEGFVMEAFTEEG